MNADAEFAIYDLYDKISDRYFDDGPESLSRDELSIFLVLNFEGLIQNGGFALYFSSAVGDLYQQTLDTLSDLDEIGAREAAVLLRQALSLFPAGTPSPDRSTREQQLDQLSERHREELSILAKRYYDARIELSAPAHRLARERGLLR